MTVADDLDRSIVRARRRLIPFLLFMYVVSFLDRANIGFAKQAFQRSTGLSEAAFALGAGLFFLTYALLEVPSNLMMHRVGAKVWMSRIMVTWGLASGATMFATGEKSFCLVRLLLGATEAGFFPGVILYLTYWFPNDRRGQILGLFYLGAPLAFIFGGPLSGLLLQLHGIGGLQGWQWMFMVEGLLAVAGGVWAFWYLDDKPADARWLPAPEKAALLTELSIEENTRREHGPSVFLAALADARVLYLALTYFLIQMSVYGVVFYLPSEIASVMGRSVGVEVGLVSAVPWVCALISVLWLPRLADRFKSHRPLSSLTLAVAGLASATTSPTSGSAIALLAVCIAVSGYIAVQPLFWTFPTGYLAGSAAAGGIAMINALGALGGFVAPNIKIWADMHFGSQRAGQFVLAGAAFCGALLIAIVSPGREPNHDKRAKSEVVDSIQE
jgi:sugar phosphate permease